MKGKREGRDYEGEGETDAVESQKSKVAQSCWDNSKSKRAEVDLRGTGGDLIEEGLVVLRPVKEDNNKNARFLW